MAIGDITLNWARLNLNNAQFSAPITSVGLQAIVRTKSFSYWDTMLNFLYPFDLSLWIAFLVNLVFMCVVMSLIEIFQLRDFIWKRLTCQSAEKEKAHVSRKDVSWLVFQSVFATQDNNLMKTKFSRTLIWLWMGVMLILVASYTAALTTGLTTSSVVFALKGIKSNSLFAPSSLSVAAKNCPQCILYQKGGNTQDYMEGVLGVDSTLTRDTNSLNPLATAVNMDKWSFLFQVLLAKSLL